MLGEILADASPITQQVDDNWTIRDTGDYDGDGRADILWRHQNGTANVFLMEVRPSSAARTSRCRSTTPSTWCEPCRVRKAPRSGACTREFSGHAERAHGARVHAFAPYKLTLLVVGNRAGGGDLHKIAGFA